MPSSRAVLIISAVILQTGKSVCTDGNCTSSTGVSDDDVSMLQVSLQAKDRNAIQTKQHEVDPPGGAIGTEGDIDHVIGVSKDKTPWHHTADWYSVKAPNVAGYERLDGDCPWNNIAVYEKTSEQECGSICEGDCSCLGFSWAPDWSGRCITKSKTCKSKDVWKNKWTFYVKLPAKLCGAKKCSAWGDPHYTSTFYGGTPDDMNLGLYTVAATKDKGFVVQGFQGILGWGAGFAAFAVKVGDSTLTIKGKTISIDGKVLGPGTVIPSWLEVSSDYTMVKVESADLGVSFKSVFFTTTMDRGPGYYHNMDMAMAPDKAAMEGVCGSSSDSPSLGKGSALFSGPVMDQLCAMLPDGSGGAACAEKVEAKTAEDICKEKGVSYEAAKTACGSLQAQPSFYKACTFDYCASDGSADMVSNAVAEKKAQEEFHTQAKPKPPEVRLLGCYLDSWDRDLDEKVYQENFLKLEPLTCMEKCEGYLYSGIQSGVECWCGMKYGKHGKADDCECDNPEWKGKGFRTCMYERVE